MSVVPGASTLIKLSDIQHPGSAGGSQITGREWREFGSEALVDSVYVFGWPYGAINLARGIGTAAAKGGLRAAGRQTLHMARPDRLGQNPAVGTQPAERQQDSPPGRESTRSETSGTHSPALRRKPGVPSEA